MILDLFNIILFVQMKVKVKTFDGEAPFYETKGACGFDFKASEEITINPGEMKLVETGTVIKIPEWYVLQTQPRSSTYKKLWLIQVNGVGIIDQDYCWEDDTIKFPYLNMTDKPVTIEKWYRIGQGMFCKIAKPEFEVVEKMEWESRWGFGTTN